MRLDLSSRAAAQMYKLNIVLYSKHCFEIIVNRASGLSMTFTRATFSPVSHVINVNDNYVDMIATGSSAGYDSFGHESRRMPHLLPR